MSLKPRRVNFTEKWQELKETIKEVITLVHVKKDIWSNRFSDIYSLCVAHPEPLADKLYYETKQFLENHVQNMLATQVDIKMLDGEMDQESSTGSTDTLLQRYYNAWCEYSQGIKYLNYLYL